MPATNGSRTPAGQLRNLRTGIFSLAPALLLVCLLSGTATAQSITALDGSVAIDRGRGQLLGNVCLTGVEGAGPFHLRLNRFLRIHAVNGGPPRIMMRRAEAGGATVVYEMEMDRASISPSRPLCIQYGGTFPVYDSVNGRTAAEDAANLVAFNGRSVRARGAARWLPMPVDPQTDIGSEAVVFRLRIHCPECTAIYMNGSSPAPGPSALFQTDVPREPFLFAGDLAVQRLGAGYQVGDLATTAEVNRFLGLVDQISGFLEDYLRTDFGPPIDLIHFPSTEAPDSRRLWAFFSDPALAIADRDLSGFLSAIESDRPRTRASAFALLAHELSHRYFGWSLGTRSPQRDFFGEPIAVFLELKAVRELLGDAEYTRALAAVRTQGERSVGRAPLAQATGDDFRYDDFRYGLAPLRLVELENQIGTERMRELLVALLRIPEEDRPAADLKLVREIGDRLGIPADAWRLWDR